MFTAVAIGQLIDAGKLGLDRPVSEIVTGLTPEASKVTIRQLLTHTAGLGDFFRPENMEAMLRARTASDILPLIAGDRPAFPPGSRFAYSNSGFALLGVVIERVSGLSYGQYLARHVFQPAGMTHTGIDPRPLATLAVGMTKGAMQMPGEGGGRLVLVGPGGRDAQAPAGAVGGGALFVAPGATEGYGSPAGGLFSTGDDLQRFAIALVQHRLVSVATTTAIIAPQIEAAPAANGRPARHYGFGFTVGDEGGLRWAGHNGGTLGANAEFGIQPEGEWVVSVLSNRDPPAASVLMRRVKDLIARPSAMASCG